MPLNTEVPYNFPVQGLAGYCYIFHVYVLVCFVGMIPLWIFTLGQYISNQSHCLKIPYTNIFAALAGIIIPVGIGLLIRRFRPNVAGTIKKALRPVFAFFIIFMFTFGVWVNLYMFKLFTPINMFAGAMLPYIGFTLGGLIAMVCKQVSDSHVWEHDQFKTYL